MDDYIREAIVKLDSTHNSMHNAAPVHAGQMTQHGFVSGPLRWFVDYGCRDDYGTTLATTSAWAGFYYFCARDTEDALVWPDGLGTVSSLSIVTAVDGETGTTLTCLD